MMRLATRSSPLALRQAHIAARRIREVTGEEVEIVPLSSLGDEDQVRPLARFLRPGAFTGRLDEALANDEADLAVHSLKDVPLRAPDGLSRPYVLERADPADRIVLAPDIDPTDLNGRRIGTSAPRRRTQLEHDHPDAICIDVRGSIGTRLQRVADGELDALMVADSALQRGDDLLPDRATALRLDISRWPTAPGQGALALQAREGAHAHKLLQQIEDKEAVTAVAVERGLLADLGGGCSTPLGATCLPPGHPEGHADHWTFHVTYAAPNDAGFHQHTFTAPDPDDCRRAAHAALQRPAAAPRATQQHNAGHVVLVMDATTGRPWRQRLQQVDHEVTHWWPFRTKQLLDQLSKDDEVCRAYAETDWVVATSARAVPACTALHAATDALPRFAAVGPATARALRDSGLPVTLVPADARGTALARLLDRRVAQDGRRDVLWLSGADVNPETLEALEASTIKLTRIPVYAVEPTTPPPRPEATIDAVLFTSPRTAKAALALLEGATAPRVLAIGPTTAAALEAQGVRATALPAPTPTALIHTLQGDL